MPPARPIKTEPDDTVDAAGITPAESKVKARYVGIEPVMAHVDGAAVLVAPGDPIMVSAEQLEQNPAFESWED